MCENFKENDHVFKKHGHFLSFLAPPVGLEPTTLRLTGLWEALKLFFTDFDMFKSEVGLIMRLAVYSIVVAVILLVFYIIFALFKALFSSKRRH